MSSPTSTSNPIPQKWTSAWSASPPDSEAAQAFVDLYTPTAVYTDHAFQIIRSGPETLRRHFNLWRTSIPDFKMTVDELVGTRELSDGRMQYSMRTGNSGRFVRDLPSRKAQGRQFFFRGAVDLVVNREGLIESVEEWYCSNLDATNGVEEFNSRSDADL